MSEWMRSIDDDLSAWLDSGGGITLKAVTATGDPVELTSSQARMLARAMLELADADDDEGEVQQPDVVSVVVETGADEAIMVGTERSFATLARLLLQVAAGDTGTASSASVDGVSVRHSTVVGDGFDELAEIVPSAAMIVRTDADRQRLRSFFESLSPGR